MEKYQNLGGDSGVVSFEVGDDFIDVEFEKPSASGYRNYRYNYGSAGDWNVEEMKKLAQAGQGLNSFINERVKEKFAKKW